MAEGQRNWWKIGFFIILFAFEVARELLVLKGGDKAQPITSAHFYSWDGYVSVQGSWSRIDGGGKLTPGTITIECVESQAQCTEATVMIYNNLVYAPEIDRFEAKFSADAVTYQNTVPGCVTYSVRLDRKLKKAFAVREKKEPVKSDLCKDFEKRIEMQVADGFMAEKSGAFLEGHFVPVLCGIWQILRLFD